VTSIGLASPPRWEIFSLDDMHIYARASFSLRELLQDEQCVIAGTVIDNDQLEVGVR
jgi:hypothetical protein